MPSKGLSSQGKRGDPTPTTFTKEIDSKGVGGDGFGRDSIHWGYGWSYGSRRLFKKIFNGSHNRPPTPGVSWNVFIREGLGAILVDRFDSVGVRRIAAENPMNWLEIPILPPGVFGRECAGLTK